MRRVGMHTAWRFMPTEDRGFGMARVLLESGGIDVEVGFVVDDLAVAANDDEALNELALLAYEQWRQKTFKTTSPSQESQPPFASDS